MELKNDMSIALNYCYLYSTFESKEKIWYFINYLYQALSSDSKYDTALFLIGESKYISTIIPEVFGDYGTVCNTNLLTGTNETRNEELLKAKRQRLIICNYDSSKKIASHHFKLLTGHETFSINGETFETHHKLLIISSTIPQFDNYDDAVKRRCVYIRITNIPEESNVFTIKHTRISLVSNLMSMIISSKDRKPINVSKTDTETINKQIKA